MALFAPSLGSDLLKAHSYGHRSRYATVYLVISLSFHRPVILHSVHIEHRIVKAIGLDRVRREREDTLVEHSRDSLDWNRIVVVGLFVLVHVISCS